MKRELEHFKIGDSYGGNQEWFRTFMMRLGGCGAETACDCSIYLARRFGITDLYPYNENDLTRDDYVKFGHIMERYLWPRRHGINTLDIYIDGYSKYLRDVGVDRVTLHGFSGDSSYEEAALTLKKQIDAGYPVPNLTLRHRERTLRDFVWHWYILNGYEESDDGIMVRTVTYSEYKWFDFRTLWETGYKERGGMILLGVTQ